MTKDEALKLALEALEAHADIGIKSDKAITAIKEALAQPEQEPVGDEIYELSKGFIESPEAIKYLMDIVSFARGDEGMLQAHYNFATAFLRKGQAILERMGEDHGDEWIKSLINTTPPAAQRTWVELTDNERNKLWRDVVKWGDPSHDDVDLMKALEAKLKEKNDR